MDALTKLSSVVVVVALAAFIVNSWGDDSILPIVAIALAAAIGVFLVLSALYAVLRRRAIYYEHRASMSLESHRYPSKPLHLLVPLESRFPDDFDRIDVLRDLADDEGFEGSLSDAITASAYSVAPPHRALFGSSRSARTATQEGAADGQEAGEERNGQFGDGG